MNVESLLPGMDLAIHTHGVRRIAVVRRILLHPTAQNEGEAVMIRSMVRMSLPAERVNEVAGILGPMAERTRTERGCLGCYLCRDVLEEAVLTIEETWASEADLARHLRSHEYRLLLLVMEMARVPPEVRFDQVLHSTGLETIEEARC